LKESRETQQLSGKSEEIYLPEAPADRTPKKLQFQQQAGIN
jgi:hypothetical protein